MDLQEPCTQKDFAQLVGITQPAISDLLTRGVIAKGQSAATWLLAYTRHLREAAAGRGADGELAANRAAESATRNELLQIKLKRARGEYVEVAALEQVLATIGAQIASRLEPLPARIKTLVPELSNERLKQIEGEITEARNLAASTSLAVLEADDPTGDIDDKVSAA
jgi:phage terminase Nu1 subunit (DNA packaging protein)